MAVEPSFNGTSLDGAHIGAKPSANAAAALLGAAQVVLIDEVLPRAAEAANVITVALQAKDRGGENLAQAVRLHCRVYELTMIEALAAAWTLAETGAGGEVSTTANAALVIDTDANGRADVALTDVSGAVAADIFLLVTPVGREGAPQLFTLTFA